MFRFIIIISIVLSYSTVSLNATTFDINEFSNPYKYGWVDENERLSYRDNIFLQNMMFDRYNSEKQSVVTNALKTAVAPGWGHFSVRSYTKGQIFLGSQLVLLGTGLYYREKSLIEYQKYENATQIDDINNYYDKSAIPHRQSTLLLTLFAIIWGYTIYDSILETNTYNYELWERLTETNRNSNVIITPTSITLRF